MDTVPVNPYDSTKAAQTAMMRLEALKLLCSRIKKMSLLSLSISVDFPLPFMAASEISSIVDNLLESCHSL